jgi:asparagine synthetase B (glutamine-hydrolysing)
VALSGESADEVFGGYTWFHDPKAVDAATFPWLVTTGGTFDGTQVLDTDLLERRKKCFGADTISMQPMRPSRQQLRSGCLAIRSG